MEAIIKPEEFNFLLDKVKKLKKGERLIKLDDKVSLMFRYSKVRIDNIYKEELMFPVLDPKTDNDIIVSLVFDAKGLHNNFITEIGVFREDKTYTMYIIPQREDAVINSFRKLLVEKTEAKQTQDPNEMHIWRSKLYISIVISIIIIFFNIVYQVHYGVHFTGLMIMAVSEVFILVILGNVIIKEPEKKIVTVIEMKEKNEMDEETTKKLEQILNSKYDNDRRIRWTCYNVSDGVNLYYESTFLGFIKIKLSLVESVNSFLRDNGWEINEVCAYGYFTLKRYEVNMITNNIDHTQYAMVAVYNNAYPDVIEKIDDKTLEKYFVRFVPANEMDNNISFVPWFKVSWSIMYPVLKTLIKEDWYFKFENDENSEELEYIQEEYDEPEERLNKIEEFFKSYLLPDPILHTRLIITPKDSETDFIFYYGKTVELQNNSTEDKYHLFRLIMERYYQR